MAGHQSNLDSNYFEGDTDELETAGVIPVTFYDDRHREIGQQQIINAKREEEPVIYLPQKTLSNNIVERILFSLKKQGEVDISQIEKVDYQVSFIEYVNYVILTFDFVISDLHGTSVCFGETNLEKGHEISWCPTS